MSFAGCSGLTFFGSQLGNIAPHLSIATPVDLGRLAPLMAEQTTYGIGRCAGKLSFSCGARPAITVLHVARDPGRLGTQTPLPAKFARAPWPAGLLVDDYGSGGGEVGTVKRCDPFKLSLHQWKC